MATIGSCVRPSMASGAGYPTSRGSFADADAWDWGGDRRGHAAIAISGGCR